MRAALAITFDNLGSAAEEELGIWPADRPSGDHESIERGLPRALELLGDSDVRATFFVEGINAERHPGLLRTIADAGHEVACHAWRHEAWGRLEPDREAELLGRATSALATAGFPPRGFRPPGGRLTAASERLLAGHGYRYFSAAEHPAAGGEALAALPFRWPLVDAWEQQPLVRLGARSAGSGRGGPLPAPLRPLLRAGWRRRPRRGPERTRAAMLEALAALAPEPSGEPAGIEPLAVLVFHPFLLVAGDALATARDVLAAAARLSERGLVRIASLGEFADELGDART